MKTFNILLCLILKVDTDFHLTLNDCFRNDLGSRYEEREIFMSLGMNSFLTRSSSINEISDRISYDRFQVVASPSNI